MEVLIKQNQLFFERIVSLFDSFIRKRQSIDMRKDTIWYTAADKAKELFVTSWMSSREVQRENNVEKNRNYRHVLYCVSIFFSLLSSFVCTFYLFFSLFCFVSKWFRESNFFFTVRWFNSTNSIFHRPRRCRGFNWAQGVSIFVECNMQSSDLSNQILIRCRLHSDAATDCW